MRLTERELTMLISCATQATAGETPDSWGDKDIDALDSAIEKLRRRLAEIVGQTQSRADRR